MLKRLDTYLANPWNFKEGVALFAHYCADDSLLNILQKGFTISGEKRMIAKLSSLPRGLNNEIVKKIVVAEDIKKEIAKIDLTKIDSPDKKKEFAPNQKIEDLKKEKAVLYHNASTCHIMISREPNQKKRFLLAQRIIQSFKAINEIWNAIDYYNLHGVLPNKYIIPTDYEQAIQDQKSINNLRANISKYKKAIATMKPGARRELKIEKLNDFQLQLQSLVNGIN